ncbi:MAG: hypothetical protein JSV44_00675 [Candidatus Zixiibacteriota bacterium]|nr:MAG: hypothetical protein JSV44_00675 [candidate division Zixibacteria bacterium]
MKLAKALVLLVAIALAVVFISSPAVMSGGGSDAHPWDEELVEEDNGTDLGGSDDVDTTSTDDAAEALQSTGFEPGNSINWLLDNLDMLIMMQVMTWFGGSSSAIPEESSEAGAC